MATAVFRCDAGPDIGAGHVMRCLALAEALQADGWQIGFAVSSKTVEAVPHLGNSGWQAVVVFV
jgi:spore coat polysaccharide biosynthesis predicted glycosyltransferase SpsG